MESTANHAFIGITGGATNHGEHALEEAMMEAAQLRARVTYLEQQVQRLMVESEPTAFPDGASRDEVLGYLLECAEGWMPDARIVGNLRAGDIKRAVKEALVKLAEIHKAENPDDGDDAPC